MGHRSALGQKFACENGWAGISLARSRPGICLHVDEPTLNSRIVDYLALKDSGPEDPMVSFELDCVAAYYHMGRDEIIYADPPEEWLVA